ncbi:PDZ domain-containing protein [Actinoplanes sp. CA-030573]|uniref:MarR family winged helix-turn-helix transcriptional regulator n=1 Tax=Actinoplanes sp. CA-030573 TaxID=3239898 RepID=UPI003D90BA43
MTETDCERDSVDDILDGWAAERPDLDVRPVGIITRLARLRSHLDAELSSVFRRYDLSPADFQVIVTLRRAGRPYRMPQARLMTQLGLTSGTVSVRIDKLVRRGVVVREHDDADARLTLVRLTDEGSRLFDELAPVHLGNEDRLLSALDDDERDVLAGLLRRLLASLEHGAVRTGLPLGMALEPAPRARARRAAVGLTDPPGLLVTDVLAGTPAAEAGVARGDLLVAVDDRPTRSEAALTAALRTAGTTPVLHLLRGDTPIAIKVTDRPATG